MGGSSQNLQVQEGCVVYDSSQPIYDAARLCSKHFEHHLKTIYSVGDDYLATEELWGRFNQWVAYVGVFAVPRASLDARLASHEEIRNMVLELLYMIQSNLIWVNVRDNTEISEPSPGLPAVGAAIDRLLILSVNIRRSSSQTHCLRQSSRNAQDESLCCLLVQTRFPNARKSLCSQLGASIHVRGLSLQYMQEHNKKLSYQRNTQDDSGTLNNEGEKSKEQVNSEAVSPNNNASSGKHRDTRGPETLPSEISPSVNVRINRMKMAPSSTVVSSGSAVRDEQSDEYNYPPQPGQKDGKKYQPCVICSMPLGPLMLTELGWKTHVDKDIEPYVCISEDCIEPPQYFNSLQHWMGHMQTRHSMNWSERVHTERWYCDVDHNEPNREPPEFDEKAKYVNHLSACHGDKLTQSQILGRIRRNRRIATRDPFVCPLCDCVPPDVEKRKGEKPYSLLWKHIAQHLKSLAFLSLSYIGDDLEDRESIVDVRLTASNTAKTNISRHSLSDNSHHLYCDRDSCDCRDDEDDSTLDWSIPETTYETTINIPEDQRSSWDENRALNPELISEELIDRILGWMDWDVTYISQQSRDSVSNLKAARNPPLFPQHLRNRISNVASTHNHSNLATTHNQPNGKAHKSLKVRLRQAIVTNPTDNRRYIPCRQLERICDEHAVAQELSKAFPGFSESLYQSNASLICHGQTQDLPITSQPCLKIFVILVLLGNVSLIESFIQHRLCDKDLPFFSTPDLTGLYSHRHKPESSLTFPDEEDQYDIIEEFLEKQWTVLIPSFEAPEAGHMRCNVYDLHEKTILPIQEISKKKYPGGFGLVEKVKIHREHNGFNHEYFALKTMHPMIPDERDRFFQQELDAFNKATPGGHIIEIRAAFKKGESRGFLFPWANGGTLNHLWAKDPHKIIADAGVSWSEFSRWICMQCHGIIRDLWAIHESLDIQVPAGTSAENPFGIHSDIKPDSIFHFTEQDGPPLGLLKVSDLGLMRFHRLVSRTVQSKSMGNAYQTYRAPESDMGKVRSRKIDIWAFGCLFAEFVTWAIGGENAIELFKTARIDEDKRFPDENKAEWSEDNFFIMKTNRLTQVKEPKRKDTVDEWFSDLTKDLGPDMANTFFPQFLRFIQTSMLEPDRKHRADSKQVESFLGRILLEKPPDSRYWHFNGTVELPERYSGSTTGTSPW